MFLDQIQHYPPDRCNFPDYHLYYQADYDNIAKAQTFSNEFANNALFGHGQHIMGLYPILRKLNTHISIKHTRVKDLRSPDNLVELHSRRNFNANQGPDVPKIMFQEIVKNITQTFADLDTSVYPDMKTYTLALQLDRYHKIRVYRTDNNAIYIITNKMNHELIRRVYALLPVLYPDIIQLSEQEKTLMKTYAGTDYDAWFTLIQAYLKQFDFEKEYTLKQIKKMFKDRRVIRMRTLKDTIETMQQEIQRFEENLRTRLLDLQNTRISLFHTENTPEEDDTEFTEYMANNKSITHFKVENNYLYLTIQVPLNQYDMEAAESIIKHVRTPDRFKEVLQTVFIKQKYQYIVEQQVCLDLSLFTVTRANYRAATKRSNPHILYHNCWGNNKAHIIKALSEGDYIAAIEQTIAACRNINWIDSTVVSKFFREMPDSTAQAFYDPETKEYYTYQQIKERECPNETD